MDMDLVFNLHLVHLCHLHPNIPKLSTSHHYTSLLQQYYSPGKSISKHSIGDCDLGALFLSLLTREPFARRFMTHTCFLANPSHIFSCVMARVDIRKHTVLAGSYELYSFIRNNISSFRRFVWPQFALFHRMISPTK